MTTVTEALQVLGLDPSDLDPELYVGLMEANGDPGSDTQFDRTLKNLGLDKYDIDPDVYDSLVAEGERDRNPAYLAELERERQEARVRNRVRWESRLGGPLPKHSDRAPDPPRPSPDPKRSPNKDPRKDADVYFLRNRDTGRVKIGISTDVPARIRTIELATGAKMDLLGTMPGGWDVEQHLHECFADERLLGEWFAPSERLMQTIACIASGS